MIKDVKMKKTLLATALALMSVSSFADTSIPNVKSQMKVTANVAAGCDLTAANINFGVLAMPIADVSAQANVQILCSKNANVELGIIYGSVGENNISANNGQYGLIEYRSGGTYTYYQLTKDGIAMSQTNDIECWYGNQQFNIFTQAAADYFNLPIGTHSFSIGCDNVKGVGEINQNYFNKLNKEAGGSLIGVAQGEKINYSLEHPTSSTTIWSTANKYTVKATGVEQDIVMKANIKAANNATHRMTPDTYTSSLTVQLTY